MTEVNQGARWEAIHIALGRLVVAASRVEEAERVHVIWMLPTRVGGRTALLVDGLSAAQMRERAERLAYHMLAESLRDDMLAWLKRVADAQSRRNNIVHATWTDFVLVEGSDEMVGPAATVQRVRNAAKGLVRDVDPFTPDPILDVATTFTKIWLDGFILQEELQDFADQEAQAVGGVDIAPWTRSGDRGQGE